ncbi:TonB-dependent receptor [Erythrobacter sp.]|jgi:outer membrane receptor protein involved in Fe transport|uniref:TonB-dependent receptor n=1 Tax=Erythrobacter sp. TaxID=1042 RepID=UPI002EB848A8|nr:TonB-dependent receptor [Erythrobacter sp.]
MNTPMRRALLAATILTPATLVPGIAQAQVVAGADALDAEEGEGNRIIVTARKKEEELQEVPTTVAVVTSETITNLGLDSFEEIANLTPGLFFDESFGRNANRPVIRGQANILGESGVAFFIDGIYYTGSLADYDVDTIERLEVVKGPQSALYGRNTYSGAINIISKKPGDVWEGRVALDLATDDRYEITAGIRGPIADGLGLGINGRFFDFGGEFENQFDGEEVGKQSSYSLSGVLDWDSGGPFTATLRGYYNRTDDGQPALFQQPTTANNCFFDDGSLYNGGGRYFCGTIEPQEINTDFSRQFIDADEVGLEADTYNVSLRMDYELGEGLTLTSLTGYNDRTEQQLTDGDYSPESFQTAVFARFPISGFPVPPFEFGFVGTTVDFSFANRSEVSDWSQELRLSYESDLFDFVVGGYYFDQSADSFSIRDVPGDAAARAGASFGARFGQEQAICAANPVCASVVPLFGPSGPDQLNLRDEALRDIENVAVFGAVNWHITPEINLGLEGRYAEETIGQTLFDFNEGEPRPAGEVFDDQKFTSFTPRVTFDWQFTPDNLLYAIYAEGIKPGGFNSVQARNAGVPTFDEEENTSYEIGIKNTFADGLLTFNIAAFYTDIEGYQLTQNISDPPNQLSATVNAGDAEVFGIEAEARAVLGNFVISANYALADTEFTSGFDEQQGILNDVADDRLVNCSTGDQFPDVDGCQSLFGSIAGQTIPRAPKHRVFADAVYVTPAPFGNGDWDFFVGGNVTYTSSQFAQVHNLARTGDATEVDARIGIENDTYRIQLYADNLFDEDAVQQVLRFADANNDFRRSFVAGLRPGRRIGLLVVSNF